MEAHLPFLDLGHARIAIRKRGVGVDGALGDGERWGAAVGGEAGRGSFGCNLGTGEMSDMLFTHPLSSVLATFESRKVTERVVAVRIDLHLEP